MEYQTTEIPIVSKLLGHLKENKYLSIVNAKDGSEYNIKDLLLPLPSEFMQGKNLVFLYSDSDLISLSYYLTFLNSDHAIALLGNNLDTTLKENLEKEYLPYIIFDQTRKSIKNFTTTTLNNNSLKTFFHLNEKLTL